MFVELLKDNLGQKVGFRFDTDEAVAKALIEKGIAKAIEGDPLAPVIARSMESMLGTITQTLNTTIDATLKEFAANSAKSRKNANPAIFGEGNTGDPNKTFGKFLLAVRNRDIDTIEKMGGRLGDLESGASQKTAMSTQTGANGGFVVPIEFHNQLMQLVNEKSIIRPRATVVPMSARTMQVPALDVTTAPSAGDTAFMGGVVGRWTEEATTLNETEPALKQMELTNYELSGYSQLSNTLIQDNVIGLEAFLKQLFARAISWYEDYAFLRGNGAGKPLGIQVWNGLISVARATSSTVKLADIAGMYARLLPGGNDSSIIWAIHPTVLAQLIQMTGGDNVIFIGNDMNGKPQMKILNYDVEVTEKVPALGSANDIGLYDCQHYLIGDRQQLEIAFSEHVEFKKNQTLWRFVTRIGGQPWLRDKITLADATSTLSPFIGLAA